MTEWDTFSLFQSLLDEFSNCLAEAALTEPGSGEDDLNTRIAVVGFSRFSLLEQWTYSQHDFIQSRLNSDLNDLSWFEDCAEAVRLFSCVCLGAMLGKAAAGDVDDTGLQLGEAHLAGFNVLNDETICSLWQNSEKRNVPGKQSGYWQPDL